MAKETVQLREILDTGYCLASESHLIQGGARRTIECHAIVALFRHPRFGWVLWDAGYALRLYAATAHPVFFLYRLVTPLRLDPALQVVGQLPRWGLAASDIRMVVISHFHADHIAGLQDFASAQFVATEKAYADIAPRRGLNALRRGFIPSLLPTDFLKRATLLPAFTGSALPCLGPTHDLFEDGSMLLVELPGHACGQIGLLANTDGGELFFVSDACWVTRSLEERRPPSRIANLIADDSRAVQETINRLHEFTLACPGVRIVPSHCPDAFQREVRRVA